MRVHRGTVRSQDGTQIAYRVIGKGRPLFCCNGLGVSAYFWRHLVAHFGNRYQIITWEYRGHGRSEPPANPYRIVYEDFIADGHAILNHLDIRDAIGIGHSAGFQVLLGLYEKAPHRFATLASFLGTAGNTLRYFFDSPKSRILFDIFYILSVFYPRELHLAIDLLVRSPLPYHLAGYLQILTPGLAEKKEIQHYLNYVRDMDPRFFAALTQGAEAHSAHHVLKTIRVPTVLIAGERDRFVPLHVTHKMHAAIRKSELFVIPRGTHAALMESPEVFNVRLGRFLARHRL